MLPPPEFNTAKKCEVHAQLYSLAEYVMVDDLKNMALDKLRTLLKENSYSFIGGSLKPQEILRLLFIAYGDDIDDQGSISFVQTEDIEILPENKSSSETATDPGDDQNVVVSSGSARANMEQLDSKTQSCEPDPLQQLVARYAAVQLECLQQEPQFGQIIVDGGHMVRDIMLAARPASSM